MWEKVTIIPYGGFDILKQVLRVKTVVLICIEN